MSGLAGKTLHWKKRKAWMSSLQIWLEPYLYKARYEKLVRGGPHDNPYDDYEWRDLFTSVARIDAETLADEYLADNPCDVTARVFHGCRVEDAGIFHRDGLRVNDPDALTAEARRIVMSDLRLDWMRPRIDQMIAEFESRERDTGKIHLCLDDRPQIRHSGHYCIYGSEWIQVLLGWGAHEALRTRGVPTFVEVDLPLAEASHGERKELASHLIQEWMHASVNTPNRVPELDFTFTLRRDVPAEWVVGHNHPEALFDPFHRVNRRTADPTCHHCRE